MAEIYSVSDFKQLLTTNPGIIMIKFGADWCGPCKRIEPRVMFWFNKLPSDIVQTIIVDIDESLELYSFMKTKKMLKGIPGILMYKKGNVGYVCDESVNSSTLSEVDQFFQRCVDCLRNLNQ